MRTTKFTTEMKTAFHRGLCTGAGVDLIAESIGVNPRTVDRRMDDDAFLADLVETVGLTAEDWRDLTADVCRKNERVVQRARRAHYLDLIRARFPEKVQAAMEAERAEREAEEREKAERIERRLAEHQAEAEKWQRDAERRARAEERRRDREFREGTPWEKANGLGGAENAEARRAYRLAEGIHWGDGSYLDPQLSAKMYEAWGL